MFGDSMFEGSDENATALGGNGAGGEGQSPNLQNTGGGDYAGAYPAGTSPYSQNEDPAYQASQDAEMSANQYTNQASSNMANANNLSAGIGRSVGLFSAIEGLVGPRQKRLRKFQRRYSREQAKAAIDNANRAYDQYKQDSAIEEQRLNQSYSGRGLGQSSIEQEGMQYFHDSQARKIAALQQNVQLAYTGQSLNRSQISASYAAMWTSFGNGVAALV